jgi:hypothetical protein
VHAGRLALIGDVGGHRQVLDHTMRCLGADLAAYVLPEDLVVVQVGDLVGGGGDDAGVVADVDNWMRANPRRWFQLIGNWEARYLGGPEFTSARRDRVPLPEAARTTLRRWVEDGSAQVAVAVRSRAGREALVTHAGLTRGFWQGLLHAKPSAQECAAWLNVGLRGYEEVVFRPGSMLGGFLGCGGAAPGPVWASAMEVWTSWAGHPQPFHQVHGHTNPYYFRGARWTDEMPLHIRASARINHDLRHVWWTDGGHRIVSIDPGLGSRPALDDLHPLVMTSATILPNSVP